MPGSRTARRASEQGRTRTYQTRIHTPASELLCGYAALMSRVERTLFARLRAGGRLADLKREFLQRFGITARGMKPSVSAPVLALKPCNMPSFAPAYTMGVREE